MVVTLTDEHLEQLQSVLKDYAASEMICGEISLKLWKTTRDSEFLVDDWPNVKAVMLRTFGRIAKNDGLCLTVFSTDPLALKTLLQGPGVIDWSQRITFAGVPIDQVTLIKDLLKEKKILFDIPLEVVILKTTKEILQLRPIPEGFRLCSLKPEQSDFVNSLWQLNQGDASKPYIKYLIENFFNFCLYNKEGQLIGYALQKETGFLGPLYVFEKYRGRGYGKAIISHLASKCLQTKDYVCVGIEPDNAASFKVHEDVGFQAVGTYVWIRCNFRHML